MKKILFSIMTLVLVVGMVGGGAFAYFSDTETSTGNTFTAGTIDLEMNEENPCDSVIFTFSDIKPCKDMDPIVIKLKNVGQNNGYLYQKITYVDKDKDVDPGSEFVGDMSANSFAALIYVKDAIFNLYIDDVLSSQCPRSDMVGFEAIDELVGNDDGYCSLYELKLAGWLPYSSDSPEDIGDPDDTLQVGHSAEWTITFHMADSLVSYPDGALEFGVEDNLPQADGIELTWTAILRQNRAIDNPLP